MSSEVALCMDLYWSIKAVKSSPKTTKRWDVEYENFGQSPALIVGSYYDGFVNQITSGSFLHNQQGWVELRPM